MRYLLAMCLPLVVFLSGCEGDKRAGADKVVTIGIISIIEHPFLEQARVGFVDTVSSDALYVNNGVAFEYQNAAGSITNANSIVAGFVGRNVDMIYSISTPATQAAKEATSRIPVVFSAVTDPVSANIVDSDERPGGNVTGVSDIVPVRTQLSTIKEVLPDAKRIGIPYNSGEANSISLIGRMRAIAPELGLTLVETTATTTADVAQAMTYLVGKVDAVYLPTDNTMHAALSVVTDVCSKFGIPLFSSEDEAIKRKEALAALTVDHYELGRIAAEMALLILKKEDTPGVMPVRKLGRYDLKISLDVAHRLGISIPQSVLDRAVLVP